MLDSSIWSAGTLRKTYCFRERHLVCMVLRWEALIEKPFEKHLGWTNQKPPSMLFQWVTQMTCRRTSVYRVKSCKKKYVNSHRILNSVPIDPVPSSNHFTDIKKMVPDPERLRPGPLKPRSETLKSPIFSPENPEIDPPAPPFQIARSQSNYTSARDFGKFKKN